MKHYYLKCEKESYRNIEKRLKTYIIIKNDINYNVGDFIHLRETINEIETGNDMAGKKIIHILEGKENGICKDYCILQLKLD